MKLDQKLRQPDAIIALNKLQSNVNAFQDAVKNSKHRLSENVEQTLKYLNRVGINTAELEKQLPVIHVTGTKGKGSTCALCESILRAHGYKTGLYTSPHLVNVRERIRINGSPLSHTSFSNYFWSIHEQLEKGYNDMPSYFKFLTLMAFKVFLKEKVDVAIVEVGIGGEYDCTNFLNKTPIVGITSIGFDHVSLLGNTLEEIAWQKSGIIKKDSLAFTTLDVVPTALKVISSRAEERKALLQLVPDISSYDLPENLSPTKKLNASLAIQMSYAFIQWKNCLPARSLKQNIDEKTKSAVMDCKWYGRFQRLEKGNHKFYLDGAHTPESMRLCSDWFNSNALQKKRLLVFNCIKKRNSMELLKPMLNCGFESVIFCSNDLTTEIKDSPADLLLVNVSGQKEANRMKLLAHSEAWKVLNNGGNPENIVICDSVQEAVDAIERIQETHHILITGSLHLVGAFLSHLLDDSTDLF